MKKLLFLLLLCTISVQAQTFEVTPEGLKEKTTGKDFAVIEAPNKTAAELYTAALKYINVAYKNPKEVIKGDVKDDYLKWQTFVSNFGSIKNSFATLPADAKITVQLSFKDGKAKYEVIEQDIYPQNAEFNKVMFKGNKWKGFPIFDEKDNKLRQEAMKSAIEAYYNSQIAKIKEYFSDKQTSNKDEW